MSILKSEHYEIRRIEDGVVVYKGRSLTKAALKLVPGTCYGKGPTEEWARWHVDNKVATFRARKKIPLDKLKQVGHATRSNQEPKLMKHHFPVLQKFSAVLSAWFPLVTLGGEVLIHGAKQ